MKAYRHVFQCISLLHQIMEHADDVSIKLLDWNCEFSVISRNNQVDAKHHHGTTYIFFLFFFLNEYSSVYVWRVFKRVSNNNITVLSFYLLVFQVRFMLKVHAFVRETSPKVLSFPKTQGRESVTCACCWIWGGRRRNGTLASFIRVLTIFVWTGRPDLPIHKWNMFVVPSSEMRMTKFVIFPEQGQLGQKQFSVRKNLCFPFARWPIQLASCGKWYVSSVS